jgi:hypothetical protein
MIDVSVEIRTWHIPNGSQKCYCLSQLTRYLVVKSIQLFVEKCHLLGCGTVSSGTSLPTFRRNVMPPFSGSKSKPGKQINNSLLVYLLIRLTLQPWRWKQYVLPKRSKLLSDYTTSHFRREYSSKSLPREREMSQIFIILILVMDEFYFHWVRPQVCNF